MPLEDNLIKIDKEPEKAIAIAVFDKYGDRERQHEHFEELIFLAQTAGANVIEAIHQELEKPNIATYLGKGKLNEIIEIIEEEEIKLAIFEDELSPVQLRNLERALNIKVLDRSNLILDIFATRAQTNEAKTQVELAQLQYMMPRLTRMWTHLSKQHGGIGTRGPGETQIEVDRRMIRKRIEKLKSKLDKIEVQSRQKRKNRDGIPTFAIVGYTNAGKSTLMKKITASEVYVEDKLFATVDSTVRKVVIGSIPFLLTDTVGFIRKLPHALIECFKSTLDEIREADILLHVVDASHPSFEEQISVVNHTLTELGASDKPMLLVFNKVDKLMTSTADWSSNGHDHLSEEDQLPAPLTLEELEATYLGNGQQDAIFISATDKTNIDKLRRAIYDKVADKYYTIYPNYVNHDTHWIS